MMMDDYDGQMIFGEPWGLKLHDICLTGDEKPRKNLTQETCPDRGSNPGPLRDKRPLGRPRRRWEDNIKMDMREVGCDYRDWITLTEDRDQWRAYVRAVMNLRVP